MKRLFNYILPIDWKDVKTIEVKKHSQINGSEEGIAFIVVIQKSESTGRYRKQTINVLM